MVKVKQKSIKSKNKLTDKVRTIRSNNSSLDSIASIVAASKQKYRIKIHKERRMAGVLLGGRQYTCGKKIIYKREVPVMVFRL